MRILHGMTERANQCYYSVLGLRALGLKAKSAVYPLNPYALQPDFYFGINKEKKLLYPWYALKMLGFAIYASFSFDTFHFHANVSLLPKNLDLLGLRLMKRMYFFEFHGSEIRQGEAWSNNNPYAWSIPDYGSRPQLAEKAKKLLQNAQAAIVHDAEIAKYLPDVGVPVYFIPLRIDISRFEPAYPSASRKPLIVHAPSNRQIKGSDYIEKAIDELSRNYEFDYISIEGQSQVEAYSVYKKADIIIDQLLIGAYGVFALEGMALGKPVIAYISDDVAGSYPEGLPIVNASIDTIKSQIEKLLLDAKLRYDIGVAGRKYVEDYHDCRKIAKVISKMYETGRGPESAWDAFKEVKMQKIEITAQDNKECS